MMDSTDEIIRLAETERQLKEQHAAKKKNAVLSIKRSGSDTVSVGVRQYFEE